MNINGYILREELTCIEGASLHSDYYDLRLTNCVMWREGLSLHPDIIYIIPRKSLESLVQNGSSLTFLCIGFPEEIYTDTSKNDILWVKEYLSYEILIPMVLKILRKYKGYTEQLCSICQNTDSFTGLKDFLLSVFENPLLLLGTNWEILQIYENSDSCRLPFPISEADSDLPAPSLLKCLCSENVTRLRPWSSVYTREGVPLECYTQYCDSGDLLRLCLVGTVRPITDSHRLLMAHTAKYLESLKNFLHYNCYQGLNHLTQNLQQYLETSSDLQNNKPYFSNALKTIGWSCEHTYACISLETASELPLHTSDLPALTALTRYSIMLPAENRFVFLCNLTQLSHTPQWIHDQLSPALKTTILTAGISTSFQDFCSFPDYCSQAHAAIRTGMEMDYTQKIYLYQDYALDYIIKEGLSALPLNILLYGSLKELLLHDSTHHTQYAQTLKVFFRNSMTMAPTAKEMGIHISTLKYRLKRIHEMLKLDLNEPKTKMYLQIVLYMQECV